MTTKSEAWHAGYESYPNEKNPYDPQSDEYLDYNDGYAMAAEDSGDHDNDL